ncbi:MAG: C4-type zinc ribbon domain-containing protein [Vicinamibacteria bacterium]
MTIEATLDEIRGLIELATLDDPGDAPLAKGEAARRESLRKSLAARLVARHEALFEAGRRPTIVPIERETCAACHLRLPTMIVSRARRAPAVLTCPHCQRMLFWPVLLEPELAAPPAPAPAKKRAPRRTRGGVAIGRS